MYSEIWKDLVEINSWGVIENGLNFYIYIKLYINLLVVGGCFIDLSCLSIIFD